MEQGQTEDGKRNNSEWTDEGHAENGHIGPRLKDTGRTEGGQKTNQDGQKKADNGQRKVDREWREEGHRMDRGWKKDRQIVDI